MVILTRNQDMVFTLTIFDSVSQQRTLKEAEFLPISSTTTKDFSVACARMKAVSSISDIKVD